MDRSGALNERDFSPLPAGLGQVSAFSASGNTIALGTADGNVLLLGRNGQRLGMNAAGQSRIIAVAVSGSVLAFLTEEHYLGFLPLEYSKMIVGRGQGQALALKKHERYSKISPLVSENGGNGQFLLWQSENTDLFPKIVSADPGITPARFTEIPLRFPLRSAQAAYGKLLLLDRAGNLSILYPQGQNSRPFSFSAAGSMDAAFINKDTVIICRNAILGNTPFLMLNFTTGETVPLAWPSQAGIMSYMGGSGGIYAVTVEEDGDSDQGGGIKTVIIRLNTAASGRSIRLVECPGEDTQFSLAESGTVLAATIGQEGALMFAAGGIKTFEWTPGLPLQLSGGDGYFISLDTEGNICWHDVRTGKVQALFRLRGEEWLLQTAEGLSLGNADLGFPE
jgi:hypothetical protein